MGKNTNTYRPKMKYNCKNKKLLKKMMNNSILEENIKILRGGNGNNIVEPSELDKALFGYKENVNITGPIDKLYDNAKNAVEYITNSFGNFVNIIEVLIEHKMIDIIGMEGKKPEEVAEILKNDSVKLREIIEFLETDKGKEMLDDIENFSKKATGIIGKSIEEIPGQLDNSMKKMANSGLKITKELGGQVPILGNFIAATEAFKGTQDAFNATTGAIKSLANLTSNTAENLKTPIDDIKKEINNISNEVENAQKLSQTRELLKNNDKNAQYGGSYMNKVNNLTQNGGKKLRKRINNTRHAFKNISRNITNKNK